MRYNGLEILLSELLKLRSTLNSFLYPMEEVCYVGKIIFYRYSYEPRKICRWICAGNSKRQSRGIQEDG